MIIYAKINSMVLQTLLELIHEFNNSTSSHHFGQVLSMSLTPVKPLCYLTQVLKSTIIVRFH